TDADVVNGAVRVGGGGQIAGVASLALTDADNLSGCIDIHMADAGRETITLHDAKAASDQPADLRGDAAIVGIRAYRRITLLPRGVGRAGNRRAIAFEFDRAVGVVGD